MTGYDIKFNKDTKKYNVLVDEDVNEIELTVTPNDSKSTVSVENNTELKAGLNKVTVKVTAENGDINEYLFNVYKIGEDKKEEIKPIEKETTEEDKINTWLIVSGVEFVVILILLISLIKKRKKKIDII